MKGRGKWLVLSAVLAIGTSYLLLQVLKSNAAQEAAAPLRVQVVVATTVIDERQQVQAGSLQIREVAAEDLPPGAVMTLEDATGKLSRQRIPIGAMLQEDMLYRTDGAGSSFALKVPDGKRAVAISNNEMIGVGALLVPGDRVDVIAGYKKEQLGGKFDEVKLVMQDIEVLAVGQDTSPEGASLIENSSDATDQAAAANEPQAQQPHTTVTLAVTPQQAEGLVFAELNGSIRLALRSPGDQKRETTTGVNNESATTVR